MLLLLLVLISAILLRKVTVVAQPVQLLAHLSEAIISSSPTRIVWNYREVSECFTVSIASLLDKTKWIHRNDCAPIFVGGPYIIWGLTGYIVDRFVRDILVKYTVTDHM